MKSVLKALISALFLFVVFFNVKHTEARASYAPPTLMCWYANALGSTYPCPPLSTNPIGSVGGTNGDWGYKFADQFGVNTHFIDPEYSNATYALSVLQALNFHHIRDGLGTVPASAYVRSTLNLLAANGIHASLTTQAGATGSIIGADLAMLNPGVVDSLEAPNEQDICCNDPSWVADDKNELINNIYPWVIANSPTTTIIGPSIGGFNSYLSFGDLSAYETYGNIHDYGGGFYPETPGYGGPGYCGYLYGGVQYNQCNSKQASVSKPIVATEFGYQTGNTANYVDDGAQGTYILRQVFRHEALGIPKSYIYELYDTGNQPFGLMRGATNARVSFGEIADFMQIVKDPIPVNGTCVVPAAITTSGVSSFGICKADGTYDLVVWQPVTGWDTNAGAYLTVNTINAPLVLSPGFGPSSITQWSYPLNGRYSNATIAPKASVPVTDRPSVIVFNGPASPTPLPALPLTAP